jgi:hypothetical protein
MSKEKTLKESKKVVVNEPKSTKNKENRRHPELKEVLVGDSILLLTMSCPSILTPIDRKTHKAWSRTITKTVIDNKSNKENWEI